MATTGESETSPFDGLSLCEVQLQLVSHAATQTSGNSAN